MSIFRIYSFNKYMGIILCRSHRPPKKKRFCSKLNTENIFYNCYTNTIQQDEGISGHDFVTIIKDYRC